VVEPVPFKKTVVMGLLGSLLVRAMLPRTVPAEVGVNVTVTGTVCPALIFFGVTIPVRPNSGPFKVIIETVRSDEPVLPTKKFAVPLEPIVIVPKSSEVGTPEICGCDEVVTVPLRFAVTGLDPDSPWMVNIPFTFPDAVPLNQTERLVLWPAAKDSGRVTPDIPN
jgi:hypothetical protein